VAAPYMSRRLYSALRAARPEALPALTLAPILWPCERQPSNRFHALEVHVSRLRKELRAAALGEDVEYVHREGGPRGWRLTGSSRSGVQKRESRSPG
jgi:hypothetical protein